MVFVDRNMAKCCNIFILTKCEDWSSTIWPVVLVYYYILHYVLIFGFACKNVLILSRSIKKIKLKLLLLLPYG